MKANDRERVIEDVIRAMRDAGRVINASTVRDLNGMPDFQLRYISDYWTTSQHLY